MKTKVITVALLVALAAVSYTTWRNWPRNGDIQVLGKPTLVPPIMAAGKDTPTQAPAPEVKPQVVIPEIQRQAQDKHSLINAYYKDPRPAVQFEGWKMAFDCITRPHPRFCGQGEGALQPGDLSQDKRLPAVIAAAKAGVPGAYPALAFHEHPRVGILKTTWADPSEWDRLVAEARQAGIEHADPIAVLTQFAPGGLTTLPPAKALEQWVAYRAANEWDTYQQRYDPKTDDTPNFRRYASQLSEPERKAAIQAGMSLAYQPRGIE